jgi:hypothetical protein
MDRVLEWEDGPLIGQLPHEMSDREAETGRVFAAADLPTGKWIHEYEVAFTMLVGGGMVLRHVASMRVGNRRIAKE